MNFQKKKKKKFLINYWPPVAGGIFRPQILSLAADWTAMRGNEHPEPFPQVLAAAQHSATYAGYHFTKRLIGSQIFATTPKINLPRAIPTPGMNHLHIIISGGI